MSQSRRTSDTLVVSIAILVLFTVAQFWAEPAAGATSSHSLEPAASFGLVADDDESSELVARPIEPARSLTAGTGGKRGFINNCLIDFNEPSVLAVLPHNAITTDVEWPFWNQHCPELSETAVAVNPVGAAHYHLGYVDNTIMWCPDLGTFGRPVDPDNLGAGCTAIDPLTEPRSGVQPHFTDYSIRIFVYDAPTGERRNFDMNQLRILSGEAEVCFVKTDLPWLTSKPTDDPPGYCGTLGPGNWDVSESVQDVYEVRVYARSANMSFTDIGLRTV